ncbi:hydroxyethylthiazole kinase [Jinshanibacter sp. LJY008]|uniref:Hydroxyethylthiazole kinase n=1 Tax=Limnobaculum eriocheiris TaxID=2897391 RepID=A0A9X1SJC3_9GAMM|nr:hydroxyethylthiazole kinase [Limnobaculum eriocheiris]MCD1124716.1 hydroxyethylthiazole kinase [Limnobaculum eriocheiris]
MNSPHNLQLFPGSAAAHWLTQLRTASPLVHCLTNQVVQNFTANVLLALGASPAMVVARQEAGDFSAIASGLLVNVGTLNETQVEAMLLAVASANGAGVPWVLDPVAVGGLGYRTDFAHRLLTMQPAAIRGNASEIMALAGFSSAGRGVDSTDDSLDALPAAVELANRCGAIVAVTGAIDYVTDGQTCYALPFGDPLMTRVVGTGCALSAVVAAFLSLDKGKRLELVACACMVMAFCGGAAAKESAGPGSFVPRFLDLLYQLQPEHLMGKTL